MTFAVPETAGLQTGATNPVSLIQSQTLTVGASGAQTFTELDVSAYAGVIYSVAATNGTGAPGNLQFAIVFRDAAGNQIPTPTSPQIPGPFFFARAVSPTTTGFQGLYYRTLARFSRVVVSNFDGTGATDVTVTAYGTSMPGRFDGPYTAATSGLEVAFFSDVFAGNGTNVHPVTNIYTGPATLSILSSVATAGIVGIARLANLVTTNYEVGVSSNVNTPAASVPIWCPAAPWSLTLQSIGAQTLSAAVIAA